MPGNFLVIKKCTGDDSTDKCGKGKSGKEDPAGTEHGVGNNINKNEDHAAKPRVFLYEFIQILISNVIFTTLWVYILSMTSPHHMALTALLAVRVPKEIISWPIQAAVDLLILKAVSKTQIAK